MDFRTINKFNDIVNTVSGNFLPLTGEDAGFDFVSAAYFLFVWLIDLTYIAAIMIGLLFYIPALEAVRTGGIIVTIFAEVIFLAVYLIHRRKDLRDLIRQMNHILVDSDDLRRCIRDSIEPHKNRLKIYAVINMSTWLIWEAQSFAKVPQTDQFTYTDFGHVTYFPGAPFTAKGFVAGILFRAIGGSYVMLKKIGIDVYINYLITLLTAEYRYLEERTAAALREKNEISVIQALKECVAHHCSAIKTGEILEDILSINIGVIYFNCIFRFCCTAFLLITLPMSYVSITLFSLFGLGFLMQIYLLCSCIQDLLEASTSVANQAFYGNWYEHGRNVKCMLHTIGLANQLECRLSAFRIIDLTVPNVATILKQSYSACLLLMNV